MNDKILKDYKDQEYFTQRALACWERLYTSNKYSLSTKFTQEELKDLLKFVLPRYEEIPIDLSLIDYIAFDMSLIPDIYDTLDSKLRDLNIVENVFMIEWVTNYMKNKDSIDMDQYIYDFLYFC